MRFPQSKNKNINNIWIVGNPVRMNSKQGGVKSRTGPVKCCIDHLLTIYFLIMWPVYVGEPTPLTSFTWQAAYLTWDLSIVV